MPRYHFDLGDSNEGPIGFCAEVCAPTRERAVEKLKQALPEDVEVWEPLDTPGIDYVQVYFGPGNITTEDIDFETEIGLPPGDHEPPKIDGWEHLRTWQYPESVRTPKFRLELCDTNKPIPDLDSLRPRAVPSTQEGEPAMSEKTYEPLPSVEQFLADYKTTGLVPHCAVTLDNSCGCPLGAYAQARANEGDATWGKAIETTKAILRGEHLTGGVIRTARDKFGEDAVCGFINGFDRPDDAPDPDHKNSAFKHGFNHGKAVNAAVFASKGSRPAGDL